MTLLQPGKNPLTTPKPTFFLIYHVKSPLKFQNSHLKFNILFYRLFRIIYENSRIENYNLLSPTSSQRCKLPRNYTQNKMSPLLPYFSIISLLINNLESALKPNSHVIYSYFITSKEDVKRCFANFKLRPARPITICSIQLVRTTTRPKYNSPNRQVNHLQLN